MSDQSHREVLREMREVEYVWSHDHTDGGPARRHEARKCVAALDAAIEALEAKPAAQSPDDTKQVSKDRAECPVFSRDELATLVMAADEFRDETSPGLTGIRDRLNSVLRLAAGDRFTVTEAMPELGEPDARCWQCGSTADDPGAQELWAGDQSVTEYCPNDFHHPYRAGRG